MRFGSGGRASLFWLEAVGNLQHQIDIRLARVEFLMAKLRPAGVNSHQPVSLRFAAFARGAQGEDRGRNLSG